MKKTNQNERGAIIVEIIAVIALLGVLGPLLFKQVLSRNEEVENINIASEVRTIKEAFSAYILANKQQLSIDCTPASCKQISAKDLIDFLPIGFNVGSSDEHLDYKLVLEAIEPSEESTNAKVFIQGFIIPQSDALPEPLKMKRAARIANLIGADGGIYIGSDRKVYGTGGTWELGEADSNALGLNSLINDKTTAVYLATTGMDTYIPEVEYEDFDASNILLPTDLALQKLHAWNYFSVGQSKDTGPNSCYKLNHMSGDVNNNVMTAKDDEIYGAGSTNSSSGKCDPLFWVGTTGQSGDTSIAGHVYVKDTLHIGHNAITGKSAFVIENNSDIADTPTNNQNRNIAVYDISGTQKVLIDATGRIISYGKRTVNLAEDTGTTGRESITMQDGKIESNEYAPLATQDANSEGLVGNENYRVDPAFTSVMNDIRLESRGGARLSDILPNYITKDIVVLNSNGSGSYFDSSVAMPSCPKNYAPAIIVTPTKWSSAVEFDQTDLNTLAGSFRTKDASANALIERNPAVTSTYVKGTDKASLALEINSTKGTSTGTNNKEDANAIGNWRVRMGYKRATDSANVFTGMSVYGTISAVAQTYCVFDSTKYGSSLPSKTNTNKPIERRKAPLN